MAEHASVGTLPLLNRERPLQKSRWLLKLKKIDLVLFGVLVSFVLLFQMQTVAEWITTLRVREILYGYLYLRVIFFYRLRFNQVFLLIILFLVYSTLLFLHTYLVYGPLMALQGFMRYVSSALLAPLAAVYLSNWRQVKWFIGIWLIVAVAGAGTLVYQIGGGNLSTLFHGYLVSRGALPRYMTLLGEPNVGGMASILVAVLAVFAIRSRLLKIFLLITAALLLVYSLSKAALLGLAVAGVLIVLFKYRSIILTKKKLIIIYAVLVLVLFSLVLDMQFGILGNTSNYLTVLARTALSTDRLAGHTEGPNILGDIWYRIFQKTADGIELVLAQRNLYGLLLFAGSGYGISGSAAVMIFGAEKAIAPHNTYLEIFLVGGLMQLSVFMLILYFTYIRLKQASVCGDFQLALFICYLVLILLMVGYPVFYQPVLGTFLWLMIGIAANGILIGQNDRAVGET